MLQHPLRFEPFFRPMIWGNRSIARYLDEESPKGLLGRGSCTTQT